MPSQYLDPAIAIARRAGELILRYYADEIAVDEKTDGSPVTAADRAAEVLIEAALLEIAPEIPIVAEEAVSAGRIPDTSGGTYWLVDPLDGTKEFINRNGDFTVNLGLMVDHEPVLGVMHTPVDGMAWAGVVGHGAFEEDGDGDRRMIQVREPSEDGLVVVASRSHRSPELEAYIADLDVTDSISRGSALKFCLVARGEADIYPRLGPTMEWDTAAGHAILLAAGGSMTNPDGSPFRYNKPKFLNGHFIVKGG
ncbi:MAG: 3'(2'),5'-bisphosphate nucleotidase CysQ [Rhodospirillaceae bacterium]|jgi:3'(2'), 5'-bisphosphate nucleotidase|nr:3'(2'),5'-bisphosphate nucleotidase CysQ [Rhodospirillaceae bacterium]MBT6139470.1 3'(2'),5'-bisphosphate nucleotidase CysQ [Rhodospirillaceae bacterium]